MGLLSLSVVGCSLLPLPAAPGRPDCSYAEARPIADTVLSIGLLAGASVVASVMRALPPKFPTTSYVVLFVPAVVVGGSAVYGVSRHNRCRSQQRAVDEVLALAAIAEPAGRRGDCAEVAVYDHKLRSIADAPVELFAAGIGVEHCIALDHAKRRSEAERRALAEGLLVEAIAAAKRADCTRVNDLGEQVRSIHAGVYGQRFVGAADFAGCVREDQR